MSKDQSSSSLEEKLKKINGLFEVEKVTSQRISLDNIAKYYRTNKIAYSLFHNKENFVHMGITRDGKYKREDLLEQAKLIEKYLHPIKKGRVLELAAGRGATCAYLAKKYPTITFNAIDLPNGQLDYAYKAAKDLINFIPEEGDYHNLQRYNPKTFDVVFVIEALCHSNKKEAVLKEVYRILKPKGVFIIIDGYLGRPIFTLSKKEKIAKRLTEKGMMVDNFEYYEGFKRTVLQEGFSILFEEDVSKYILPSLYRFERQAQLLFTLPVFISKLILRIFPAEFTNNALSGYLMPYLIDNKIARYTILILEKKG